MNVNKLSGGGQDKKAQPQATNVPRRFNHNAQSQQPVQEKKKISDFMDITEAEFVDLVSERDILAAEIIFTRTGQQYSSQCFEVLQQYEKTAAKLEHALAAGFEASLQANEAVQSSIFAEMEVATAYSEQRRASQSHRLATVRHRVCGWPASGKDLRDR